MIPSRRPHRFPALVGRTPRAGVAGLALCLSLALAPFAASAQQVAFTGLKGDSTLPVTVDADTLTVRREENTALFTGRVVAVQGDMKLTADRVLVKYGRDQREIESVHATGNVVLTTPTEAASGHDAFYTIATSIVVMTGDVLLTQGSNTMNGQKLVVNLTTGLGTMDAPKGGRVSTTFTPGEKAGQR